MGVGDLGPALGSWGVAAGAGAGRQGCGLVSQDGCVGRRAGDPRQLLGPPGWAISERESIKSIDFTEQLLDAVRLFPAGSFTCWDCQNEIFSQFPVHGKLKKKNIFCLIQSKTK